MFPYETNSYSGSDLDHIPAAPLTHFIAPRPGEPIAETLIISSETQRTELKEPPTRAVKTQDWVATPLIWLLPLWGAIVWLLLLSTASEAWKLVRYSATSTKQAQRVPCKNCRFFSNNFYLKCAVRPSDALSERAIDCSDFCQKLESNEAKPQIKRIVRH